METIMWVQPLFLAVTGVEIALVIVIGGVVIGAIQGIYNYFDLRSQFQKSTSVAIAHTEPPLGASGGAYSYRATLIPAAIGGASAVGTLRGLTVVLDSRVAVSSPTTTTAGFTPGSSSTAGTTMIPAFQSLYVTGAGPGPVDLSYTDTAGDMAWTRRVLNVTIDFPFTLFFFFTATGTVTYKEYVPGPYSTELGAPAPNHDLSGIPG